MSWINKIPGCFGSEDREFALHNNDRTRAQEMLSEALLSDVGFAEYKAELESWLTAQGCNPEHTQKQLKRISNLGSYFQYD